MDKKYGPAHWSLITPRRRLSLSTVWGDKDSGFGFSISCRIYLVLITEVLQGRKIHRACLNSVLGKPDCLLLYYSLVFQQQKLHIIIAIHESGHIFI